MDPQAISNVRQQLLEEQARIETELSKFSHRNQGATEQESRVEYKDVGNEEGDNAAEVAQFSDNISLEEELEKALRDVIGAIKMIDDGTYGTCKYCKLPIDERRLLARPTSSSCIQCKKTLTQEV